MTHILQRDGIRLVTSNKCASASLGNMFCCLPGQVPYKGPTSLHTSTLRGDVKKARHFPEPLMTAIFIRHPLARVASTWNALVRLNWHTPFATYEFTREMTFEEFVQQLLVLLSRNGPLDPHMQHQDRGFSDARGHQGHLQVMRVDEIETAWPQFVRTWGINCTVNSAHMNRTDYPDGVPWTALYDDILPLASQLLMYYSEDLRMWLERDY